MRAIVIDRPGSYERLRLAEIDDPEPAPGEVVVEAAAIGVNYADCCVRMGLYTSAKQYVGWPITPGFEVAGRVAALGEGVGDLAIGDEVLAVTRFGAYAERLAVPRHQVFGRPAELSVEAAAGFPAVHLTAYYALCELIRLRRGAKLLVHSAAGGVGGALVQIGALHGCEVTGVVGGPHKVDAVRELGAHRVIDKSSEDLWPAARSAAPDGYDVVLDANGAETLRSSYASLAPEGKLVVYGFHTMLPRRGGRPRWLKIAWDWLRTPRFNPLNLTAANHSILAMNLSFLFHRGELLQGAMREMLGWVREGKLRAPRVTTYPLERVADAHRDLESGQTVGKLVLSTGT